MRLINKDELPIDLQKMVDSYEEVDAIPIEWLKKEFCSKGTYASMSYLNTKESVKKVIRRWREWNT